MSILKKVAIVGRMNVGKSTLFNRLSTNIKSLTLDYEGVTRDFIKDVVSWRGITFELIDTGGISLKTLESPIDEAVRQIALNAVNESDLVLFVVDGTVGILPQERELATFLHKSGKEVILIVNKYDTKAAQENLHDFYQLGFAHIIPLSAQHGTGIGDLLHAIVDQLASVQTEKNAEEPKYSVVLLGKPNVGKSSLLNTLLKKERSIVADMPGTTREAIGENINFYKETIQLVDTAGVRKKRAVSEDIEGLMVKSTFHAVRNADIILLLVDAAEGRLSDQELKLAFYAFEQGKALILLFNKEDLATEDSQEKLNFSFEEYKFFLDKIDTLHISCKTGKNVGRILPLVDEVWQRYSQKFSDVDLTMLFKQELERRPLFKSTNPLVLQKAKQIKVAPITIVLYVNDPTWFGPSQLTFFENVLRDQYNLKSVPVMLIPRKR